MEKVINGLITEIFKYPIMWLFLVIGIVVIIFRIIKHFMRRF